MLHFLYMILRAVLKVILFRKTYTQMNHRYLRVANQVF
jgi:hypothetical protein